jgi:hypothetical protein
VECDERERDEEKEKKRGQSVTGKLPRDAHVLSDMSRDDSEPRRLRSRLPPHAIVLSLDPVSGTPANHRARSCSLSPPAVVRSRPVSPS